MSLFDRKRTTPVPDLEPEPEQPRYRQPEVRPQIQPQPLPPAAPAQASRPPAPPAKVNATYGIQKAIELMRSLPSDNVPLIVQVVRTTLESTNVDVMSIIEDAEDRRARITSRIEGLRREISNFEEEIEARREEIVALEADHAETKLVQERLEMGLKQAGPPVPPRPPTAARPPRMATSESIPKPAIAKPPPAVH